LPATTNKRKVNLSPQFGKKKKKKKEAGIAQLV
jgi:hypothetical protein